MSYNSRRQRGPTVYHKESHAFDVRTLIIQIQILMRNQNSCRFRNFCSPSFLSSSHVPTSRSIILPLLLLSKSRQQLPLLHHALEQENVVSKKIAHTSATDTVRPSSPSSVARNRKMQQFLEADSACTLAPSTRLEIFTRVFRCFHTQKQKTEASKYGYIDGESIHQSVPTFSDQTKRSPCPILVSAKVFKVNLGPGTR